LLVSGWWYSQIGKRRTRQHQRGEQSMADAWSFVVTLLTDPAATRLTIEALASIPAAVRAHHLGDIEGDPGLSDFEHAPVWQALARDVSADEVIAPARSSGEWPS
jgi:hypothetical protein